MVPLSLADLHGRRILLLLVPLDAPRRTLVVAGDAEWTGEALLVRHSADEPPVVAHGPAGALWGFAPQMLPRLMLPAALAAVQPLVADVSACLAIFSDAEPRGALALDRAFYGLGGGADGSVLLFQGTPDEGVSGVPAASEQAEPWAAEPWEPGPRAT